MAFGVSNGHVTGNVTWPWKIKVVSQIYLDANISKTVKIETRFQWHINRKKHMADRLVTW